MTVQIASLLVLIVVALVLFALERLPTDVIALGMLLALVLCGLLPAEQAFASFANDAVVLIFGLLVLTATLTHTGVVDMIGRAVLRLTAQRPSRLLSVLTVSSAALSAFISNTATTALFVPIAMGLARRYSDDFQWGFTLRALDSLLRRTGFAVDRKVWMCETCPEFETCDDPAEYLVLAHRA